MGSRCSNTLTPSYQKKGSDHNIKENESSTLDWRQGDQLRGHGRCPNGMGVGLDHGSGV